MTPYVFNVGDEITVTYKNWDSSYHNPIKITKHATVLKINHDGISVSLIGVKGHTAFRYRHMISVRPYEQ